MNKSTALEYNRSYILQVYNYMTLALLLTGLIAMLTVSSKALMNVMYTVRDEQVVGFSSFGWLVSLAPIGIALTFSLSLPRMSIITAQVLFWTYSILMGLSLSSIFLIYTGESIASVFFITATIFGGMSLYGYTTEKDLTSLGSFLIMGLIGVIAASLVNLFLRSTALNFALSLISVLIFTGLTAFDVQRIKSVYSVYGINDKEASTKISIIGALTLYLDFINIFVHLLQLFGKRREQ